MDKKTFFKNNAKAIFGIAAFALALICAVLGILARVFFFDNGIGYYKSGAMIPTLFIAFCACFIALAAAFCFIPKLRIDHDLQTFTLPVRIGAFALALGMAMLLFDYLSSVAVIVEESLLVWNRTTVINLIFHIALKALITAHFLRVGISKNSSGVLNVAGNILFIVHLVMQIVSTYFNATVAMNSPQMILLHLSLVSAMMLFVSESRIGLGAPRASSRAHAFWAALSTMLCASFAFSEAAAALMQDELPRSSQGVITINSIYPIVFFIFVFSATRLFSICFTSSENVGEQEEPALTGDVLESTDAIENTDVLESTDTPEGSDESGDESLQSDTEAE